MNTHKNARLTYLRRLELVQDITERGLSPSEAAAKQGVSAITARKWLGRYLAEGAAGLLDKSSRPALSPRRIDPGLALVIVELRRKLTLQAQIASYMGISKATVSRVLRRAGLSRLSDLRPPESVQRYEREQPGELLHIDIKKLGRIERPGHRVTGNPARLVPPRSLTASSDCLTMAGCLQPIRRWTPRTCRRCAASTASTPAASARSIRHLGSELSLTEVRVLYELAHTRPADGGRTGPRAGARCRLPEPHPARASSSAAGWSARHRPPTPARACCG